MHLGLLVVLEGQEVRGGNPKLKVGGCGDQALGLGGPALCG